MEGYDYDGDGVIDDRYTTTYDAHDRVVSYVHDSGDDGSVEYRVDWLYNDLGLPSKRVEVQGDDSTTTTTWRYDRRDRLTSEVIESSTGSWRRAWSYVDRGAFTDVTTDIDGDGDDDLLLQETRRGQLVAEDIDTDADGTIDAAMRAVFQGDRQLESRYDGDNDGTFETSDVNEYDGDNVVYHHFINDIDDTRFEWEEWRTYDDADHEIQWRGEYGYENAELTTYDHVRTYEGDRLLTERSAYDGDRRTNTVYEWGEGDPVAVDILFDSGDDGTFESVRRQHRNAQDFVVDEVVEEPIGTVSSAYQASYQCR